MDHTDVEFFISGKQLIR